MTQGDSVARYFRSAVEEYGQKLARNMEQELLAKLCAWRERLVKDDLEVEVIRAELVREMVEVRKRARQRKELKIRAEEAQ